MATIRSYLKPFEVIDTTEAINLIPNQYGLVNDLGIFTEEGVVNHTIAVESLQGTLGLVGDRKRGERNNVNKDDLRSIRTFQIPHFPVDDMVSPFDVVGKRAYGSDQMDTADAVIARKLESIRRKHALTLEYSRIYTLTTGNIYAPNATVPNGSYFTEFGITQKVVNAAFGTATTDVMGKLEEGIAHIQENIQSGENIEDFVILASPQWFAAYINHPKVVQAYTYYSSSQEPLRNRLPGGRNRTFVFGGVTVIEYRGNFGGAQFIPAGEAVMIPKGVSDNFVTYFSPSMKFGDLSSIGEKMYSYQYYDPKDEQIILQTESNHLSVLRRPQVVVKYTNT